MQKLQMLSMLADKVSQCNKCQELTKTRTQTVFGDGNPNAKVVFLGESPGQHEDEQGTPFVGRAGQLLNNIIKSCGLNREKVYICNILKCRPPGNRNPAVEEVINCKGFLDLQLKVINPDYIVCLGLIAAHNLLGPDENKNYPAMWEMRGKWYRYKPTNSKVLCTYHPAYLLRNPDAKKKTWDDLKLLREVVIDGT